MSAIPFLTTYDPPGSSEGTLDADWLAQPGAENRLQQAIQEASKARAR